jgi:methyl-accepting chemotaxis protein
MEAGTREVENGTTLANQAGSALQKIVDGANRVTEMVIQIAAASEEQSAAAEQISRNVEGINAVSKQSAAGSAQSAEAAKQVSDLAEQLQNGVANFKLIQG